MICHNCMEFLPVWQDSTYPVDCFEPEYALARLSWHQGPDMSIDRCRQGMGLLRQSLSR
jgi:hypothetical protein